MFATNQPGREVSTTEFTPLAADCPAPAVSASAPIYSWTGFYIGANIGDASGHHNVDFLTRIWPRSFLRWLAGARSIIHDVWRA